MYETDSDKHLSLHNGEDTIWRGVFFIGGERHHTNPNRDQSIVKRDLELIRGLPWVQIDGIEEVK